jgi:NADH:ubiquinone oxidoreductase subunit
MIVRSQPTWSEEMTGFKIGDKVCRVENDNGEYGACIGTIATVTGVGRDGFINVYYPGCFDEENGSELWYNDFAELVQESQHEFFNEKDEEEEPMTLQDAYLAMQEACGIKVGDAVRVLRKAEGGEMGWNQVWVSEMDKYVGEDGVVGECYGSNGFLVQFPGGKGWRFPFFVLEKIADAPRFITINGFEVPEPVREPLETGEKYWVVEIGSLRHCNNFVWDCDDFDRLALQRGLIHRTQEAAEKHARALLSFTENTGGGQ